jgi:hypothetical protein|tara:strand:- start:1935 stop:2630 length:696 start_codon:yes stop_codon:yes gene_type:complete
MIEWKDDNDIYGRMLVLTNNPLFNNLRNAVDNHDADLSDALSWGQLKSKRWLVTELESLDISLGTVFLCAGWYATLAAMLFQSKCNIDKIRSFDIDESCLQIADTINRNQVKEDWKFKSITQDIMDIDYNKHEWQIWSNTNNRMNYPITDTPNTIINTSCEHIENFEEWYAKIPSGKLVILQSNNFFEVDEHVNCVNDINEFKRMSPMNTVLYSGELQLPKYYRFMLIGYR